MNRLVSAGASEMAYGHKKNNDYYIEDSKSGVYIVSDGFGNKGDEAATFIGDEFHSIFENEKVRTVELVTDAFASVYKKFLDTFHKEYEEMGATVAVAVVQQYTRDYTKFIIGSLGGARAYALEKSIDGYFLNRLTIDNFDPKTAKKQRKMQDRLAEVENEADLQKNKKLKKLFDAREEISTCIRNNSGVEVFPQVQTVDLAPSDQLVLTTNGVTNSITETEFGSLLANNAQLPPEQIANGVVNYIKKLQTEKFDIISKMAGNTLGLKAKILETVTQTNINWESEVEYKLHEKDRQQFIQERISGKKSTEEKKDHLRVVKDNATLVLVRNK